MGAEGTVDEPNLHKLPSYALLAKSRRMQWVLNMGIITAHLPDGGAKYRLLLDDILCEIGRCKAEAPQVSVCAVEGHKEDSKVQYILDHQYHLRQWILQPEPDVGKGLHCLMIINMGSKLTLHMPEPDDGEGLPCQIIDAGRKLTLHILDLLGYHMAS
ncbi:hypothetical protein GUJ93_ZPchr0006g46229 [Zizania palustris]|uniref:Uncharacterized protein n=1 Tax=Zizania palustris TaxID=103762 RepID=A0A8J5W3G9_ZIZPA|nr:hypothetical protein GUJ93_ZPchr0006g46229 [Zizania palustris]